MLSVQGHGCSSYCVARAHQPHSFWSREYLNIFQKAVTEETEVPRLASVILEAFPKLNDSTVLAKLTVA